MKWPMNPRRKPPVPNWRRAPERWWTQARRGVHARAASQRHALFPDRNLAIAMLFVVRELPSGCDIQDVSEQFLAQFIHIGISVEQHACVEVDPVRLALRNLRVR